MAASTFKGLKGKQREIGQRRAGALHLVERQGEEPLVHRIPAPLQRLVELGGGIGVFAQAVVRRAHFTQRGHALVQRDVAAQCLLVIADGFAETAAAGEGVAHQKISGRLFVAVRQGAIDDLAHHVDGAVQPDEGIVRDAVAALLREAHLSGHPLAQIQQEGVGMGLELGHAGGEFIGEIGIVVQQLGAGVDYGLGAQGGYVVGVVF